MVRITTRCGISDHIAYPNDLLIGAVRYLNEKETGQ
jgi:hypothetical protein